MKTIDESRLETDLDYRFQYLANFIGFGPNDVAAIHGLAPLLGPLIPSLVERTYEKLLGGDATARHFLPPQHGHDGPGHAGPGHAGPGHAGPRAETLAELTTSSAQIQFRKEHLVRYLMQMLGRSYDGKMTMYLDMVGKMHTHKAGNAAIVVPLVQMNALLGLLSDLLCETISQLPLDAAATMRALRAFNKLLWIQNDLVVRHYAAA